MTLTPQEIKNWNNTPAISLWKSFDRYDRCMNCFRFPEVLVSEAGNEYSVWPRRCSCKTKQEISK